MTRFFSSIISLAVVSVLCENVEAQEKVYPVTGSEGNVRVQYLIEKESSVQLLCRFTPDASEGGDEPYLKNVGRKTHIVTPDGNYALISTIHIPVWNEADMKYAYIKKKQPVLNCILEFEKFPYDETFDVIEDGGISESFALRGLSVSKNASENITAAGFLADTPYSEYGCYFAEGSPVHSFDDGDINVLSTGWPLKGLNDHEYLSVGFQIVNRGAGPLTVKFSDVSVNALTRTKKNTEVNCKFSILDWKSANKEWHEADERDVMNQVPTNAGQMVANAATRAAIDTGVNAMGSMGLLALGAIVRMATKPDYEPYMKELNKEREDTMKLYLKDSTIQPGDTLSTFLTVKYYGVPSSTTVSISLNGESYTMKY